MTWAPWEGVHQWSPFKIDALGLVTLLGAEEINSAVGRLVRSTYLEYLPLLGAFIIAGDRFTEKAAGFNLYNISRGIHTTDLSAWLTRWMLSQDFELTRSFVVWKIVPPKSRRGDMVIGAVISFVFNGFLVALTILSRDWYGFANALAMIISIAVRCYVIGQQRAAIDYMMDEVVRAAAADDPPPSHSYEAQRLDYRVWKDEKKAAEREKKGGLRRRSPSPRAAVANGKPSPQSTAAADEPAATKQAAQQVNTGPPAKDAPRPPRPSPKQFRSDSWTGKVTKVLIIQSDSKAVTFWLPNELLAPPSVFIEGPILRHPRTYFMVRSLGWLVFAVHIVSIGMAVLASQLYTVALLVLPTVLLTLKFGCDDSQWIPTIKAWTRQLLQQGRDGDAARPAVLAHETSQAGEFVLSRECWIGSRLKAEVYEWPASYEFQEIGPERAREWKSGMPPEGDGRSKKRQDLYAWLALTQDEEESMDKWDLFPHIREGNKKWWNTYKSKKNCLRCHPTFGPRLLPPSPSTPSASAAEHDLDDLQKKFRERGRTSTKNFVKEPVRQANVVSSSAFPALSDHPGPMLVVEEPMSEPGQPPSSHHENMSEPDDQEVGLHGDDNEPSTTAKEEPALSDENTTIAS